VKALIEFVKPTTKKERHDEIFGMRGELPVYKWFISSLLLLAPSMARAGLAWNNEKVRALPLLKDSLFKFVVLCVLAVDCKPGTDAL